MDLYNKYGYCIIPKGTILFRECNLDKSYHPEMFFAFEKGYANTDAYVNTYIQMLQVWRVRHDIKLPFLVACLCTTYRATAAIHEIWNTLFLNDQVLGDLAVKKYESPRRATFFRILKEWKINGWFAPIDNEHTAYEMCLFMSKEEIEHFLEKVELIEKFGEKYRNHNSIETIQFKPSKEFFNRTRKNLELYPFKKHKKSVDACIKEDIENGLPDDFARIRNFSIRILLNV